MRLIALTDISDSIGTIRKGSAFICNNRLHADNLIAGKLAAPEETLRTWGEENGMDWRGMTVAILASGPSLSEEQCETVRAWREASDKRRVIVINTTYQRAPWADVLYACDAPWWHEYYDQASTESRGQLWTQDKVAAQKYKTLKLIPSFPGAGLSRKSGQINQGGNGGYQAIGLAHQAGAKRIILLGFDMHAKGGKHWHGDHPRGLNKRLPFADWIAKYQQLAIDLKAEGVEVVNATPDSALPWFPKASIEDALV